MNSDTVELSYASQNASQRRSRILKRTGYGDSSKKNQRQSFRVAQVPLKIWKLERVYGPKAALWSRISVSEER